MLEDNLFEIKVDNGIRTVHKKLTGRILVIDPTSPEPNRGSFCYLPYIFHNFLNTLNGVQVEIKENFTLPEMDGISQSHYDSIFVALWSYPQIEFCNYIHRTFKNAVFFGYRPLIQRQGLPFADVKASMIRIGIRQYPENYHKFEHLLLSDCDQHIVKKGEPPITMIPMFTSYGCPRGCKFCSATVNTRQYRVELLELDVFPMLRKCHLEGRHAIHFTDEDFFFDTERALSILCNAVEISDQWQFIALAHLDTLEKFINRMDRMRRPTRRDAIWKCLRLVEVGLESADSGLACKMGKRNINAADKPVSVARRCPAKILWLTMTFFPGETIGSLNRTGQFLQEWGLNPDEMSPRIVTNGTRGGLGQFFQYYDGCGIDESELAQLGQVLTDRPMRLLPSFVPYSFLDSRFQYNWPLMEVIKHEVLFYVSAYGLNLDIVEKVRGILEDFSTSKITPDMVACKARGMTLPEDAKYNHFVDVVVYLAILARLGVITEA